MNYTKQEFKSGEKLFAAQLNAMDEQIAANAEAVDELSEEKVSLPKDDSGKPVYGIVGAKVVSDGAGGIRWEDTFTEREMAFFYTSGNVDDNDYTYTQATGSNWLGTVHAGPSGADGTILSVDYDPTEYNLFDCRLFLYDEDGKPYMHTGMADSVSLTGGFAGELYKPSWWAAGNNSDNQGGSFGQVSAPFSVKIPAGCTVLIQLRNTSDGHEFARWVIGGGVTCKVTYETDIVVDEKAREDIKILEGEVSKLTAEMNADKMPDYWKSYLDGKLPDIRNKLVSAGVASDSFLYFTDHHIGGLDIKINANNTKHIIDYVREHTPVQRAFFGGDVLCTMTGQTHEQAMKWLWAFHDDYLVERGVLPVIGNHESNTPYNTTGDRVTIDETYTTLFKNAERQVDTDGHFYYLLDNASQKIRYIVLDTESSTIGTNTEQLQWFIDALSDMESDWTAVLFSHIFTESSEFSNPKNPIITQIAGSYNTRGSGSGSGVSWDFASGKGTVACLICGHNHFDSSGTNNGILVVNVTTDCGANASQAGNDIAAGGNRKAGDISEQAVDFFIINTSNHTIETVRLGYGVDRSWVY